MIDRMAETGGYSIDAESSTVRGVPLVEETQVQILPPQEATPRSGFLPFPMAQTYRRRKVFLEVHHVRRWISPRMRSTQRDGMSLQRPACVPRTGVRIPLLVVLDYCGLHRRQKDIARPRIDDFESSDRTLESA